MINLLPTPQLLKQFLQKNDSIDALITSKAPQDNIMGFLTKNIPRNCGKMLACDGMFSDPVIRLFFIFLSNPPQSTLYSTIRLVSNKNEHFSFVQWYEACCIDELAKCSRRASRFPKDYSRPRFKSGTKSNHSVMKAKFSSRYSTNNVFKEKLFCMESVGSCITSEIHHIVGVESSSVYQASQEEFSQDFSSSFHLTKQQFLKAFTDWGSHEEVSYRLELHPGLYRRHPLHKHIKLEVARLPGSLEGIGIGHGRNHCNVVICLYPKDS